jgi:hypothetical protein
MHLWGRYYLRVGVTSGPPIIWRPRVALDRAAHENGNSARVLCAGIGWWIFYIGVVEEVSRDR